jgi:hypothetical protein
MPRITPIYYGIEAWSLPLGGPQAALVYFGGGGHGKFYIGKFSGRKLVWSFDATGPKTPPYSIMVKGLSPLPATFDLSPTHRATIVLNIPLLSR